MIKLQPLIPLTVFLFAFLLNGFDTKAQNDYPLHIRCVDYDSAFVINELGVQNNFNSLPACQDYTNKLPEYLHEKGYMTAAVDSLRFDSLSASMVLYLGNHYQWSGLDVSGIDKNILESVGWRSNLFSGKPMDYLQVQLWQERLLSYMEKNGYPFAKVFVDSIQLEENKMAARLNLEKGPLYVIDSIRVYGDAKISNEFLQRYLDISNGSIYDKEKLERISKKLAELNFVQEIQASNLTLLESGSILNLYLKQKKSSQVNVLIGFLPNNDQLSSKKILITGEANINLRNALGAGETIGLNWQQLQVKSPRLNLLYQHPYIFNSPIGIDFTFDMFRKDSTFLNVNFQLGAQYILNANQSGKIFIQHFQTIVNGVNTNFILQNHRLPDEADVNNFNIGIDYDINTTNYRLNPTSGNEFRIITSIGTRKIKKNNEILALKDPNDPSADFGSLYDTVKLKTYQLRVKAAAAHYFPVGRQGTLRSGVNAGILQSENIFKNELFQVGGYKLLRGFDEESQYLSQYLVGSMEYRYLVGVNSYFYTFVDGGWGRNYSQNSKNSYTYISTGLGLAFETKVGVFNLAIGVGKRDDTEFNLRQSKIHFGFVNYF
jgi:outer membrane protein assembly factor BamA